VFPGEIPKELEGTLLRNGPGLFEVGGVGISHPLDGDGMVLSSTNNLQHMVLDGWQPCSSLQASTCTCLAPQYIGISKVTYKVSTL
jgi:hypothetical protein